VSFHILLLQLVQKLLVLRSLSALQPTLRLDVDFLKGFGHFVRSEVVEQWISVEQIGFEEVELGS
jgi:hypothetical protein